MLPILFGILLIGLLLIIYYKLKAPDKDLLLFSGFIISVSALFFISLFDPLLISGFLAFVITQNAYPSIFAIISGLIVINCAVYGVHILISAFKLRIAERSKNPLIRTGPYAKRRHPIFASYQIIGLSLFVLMGSLSGVIIFSILMLLLFIETFRIERRVFFPKFKDDYLEYVKFVPKRIYSKDVLGILLIIYIILVIALIGVSFFSEL
jgi:protein-S-isoprenylcysteine O-methyltransferase Ste14